MKAKVYSFLVVLFLLIVALWIVNREDKGDERSERRPKSGKEKIDRGKNAGFKRRISALEYTSHARCRMKCRQITQAEVRDIMKNGIINYRKSDVDDTPCPTYALEGYTLQDNQHVRIVFAQCKTKTRVVTCIDLDADVECDCK